MENIAHTFAGVALSRAGLNRKMPMATPALVIAANLPDIDIFGWLIGKNYLDFHRGITHALAGAAVLSTGLAGAFFLIDRIRKRRAPERVPFFWFWVVCLAGVMSHPALDFLNDYGIRPWMPFNDTWHYGDLLSIVDPWLWIIFGSALYLGARSRLGRLGWLAWGCLMFTVVSLGRDLFLAFVWALILGAAIFAGQALTRRGRNPALVSLAVFVVYLGGVLAVRESVARSARAAAPRLITDRIERIEVLPGRPTSAHPWTVVAESAERFFIADVGLQNWDRNPPVFEVFDKNLDDPCYLDSLTQDQMAVMARFARFPSASAEVSGNTCTVWLRDLRYARTNQAGWGAARATVSLPKHPATGSH